MTAFCKTRVPPELKARVEAVKVGGCILLPPPFLISPCSCFYFLLLRRLGQDDDEALKALGITLGTEMSKALMVQNVPVLHYYTLNADVVVLGILGELGLLKPESQ